MGNRIWVAQGTLALHAEGGLIFPMKDDVLSFRSDASGTQVELRGRHAGRHAVRESAEEIYAAITSGLPARWLEE